jgi:hypothetical protein
VTSLRAQIFNAETRGVVGFADSLDALGTFEFLFRNELIGRIDKLISEQADSSGLSDEESGRQTGEASTKRLSTLSAR